jgi:tryptophan-rich sensory protein
MGQSQYSDYIQPWWAPPAWLFSPVWTFLYILIAISFGAVLIKYIKGIVPFAVLLPFLLNIVFNLLFTPIQFGLQNNLLASIDIILVLGTLVWAMIVIYPHAKWISFTQIPYLVWVAFATVLQLSITYLNW